MCALATGQAPARNNRVFFARAAVAAIMATLGGCASNQADSTAAYSGARVRVAQVVTDVEGDGLPAQTPLQQGNRPMPDDPNEPFSRNYGGANPSASAAPLTERVAPQHAPNPKVPSDLPPAFRQKLAAALSENE